MCTAVTFGKESLFFGRNMDIPCDFGQKIVITPRGYSLAMKKLGERQVKYAMIGMANVSDNFPLYAEAVNECGLCMAGLYLPENAVYAEKVGKDKQAVAPYELIPYILGECKSVEEAKKLLVECDIIAEPFSDKLPLAPLHWILSDIKESVTLERTKEGMNIYDNPFGVLTNNPPFPFHKYNVRQYSYLSVLNPENAPSDEVIYGAFSEGMGSLGLPGDYSSASRFVKALFLKRNSVCEPTVKSNVMQVFHILESVAMVRGSVMTSSGAADVTIYSSCMDAGRGVYYYRGYEDSGIMSVAMTDKEKLSDTLTAFELTRNIDFIKIN